MSGLDPRLSKGITTQAAVGSGLSLAHSLWARGFRRTLLFSVLGHAVPVLGEYSAVKAMKVLRHHVEPQAKGIPLAIVLGWYNVGYATFAMMESILNGTRLDKAQRGRSLWIGTGLVATSLDLLVDPFGLDLGLWEWNRDGRYATEVEGPNGRHGVPLLNFGGWLGLTASVAIAYERFNPDGDAASYARSSVSGSPEAGRIAALLLLPYYLPAVAWALKRGRRRYLLYSAPFLAALCAALKASRAS
jgi:hypothetical protein